MYNDLGVHGTCNTYLCTLTAATTHSLMAVLHVCVAAAVHGEHAKTVVAPCCRREPPADRTGLSAQNLMRDSYK